MGSSLKRTSMEFNDENPLKIENSDKHEIRTKNLCTSMSFTKLLIVNDFSKKDSNISRETFHLFIASLVSEVSIS